MSKFYGIGVGVGNKYNLTKNAIEVLKKIDILFVPFGKKDNDKSVAYKIVESYLPDNLEIRRKHFPMSYDSEELKLAWENISNEIIREINNDKNVGFVTIGDPMVYSTYIYLFKLLKEKVDIETIPGITSFLDIASNCNFPLVEGDEPLVIVPATIGVEKVREYLIKENSIVIMKVYKNFNEIKELIIKENLIDYALVVSNSSKENQEIFYPITDANKDNVSYFTTILINKNYRYK